MKRRFILANLKGHGFEFQKTTKKSVKTADNINKIGCNWNEVTMQYLKDDLREKILESAVAQFAKKGFQAATMRDIASKAGISSGNIYRYFESKEALFDCAVGPTYELVRNMESELEQEIQSGNVSRRNFHKLMTRFSKQAFDIFLNHGAEMLILFERSKGTKFSDTKDRLKRIISAALQRAYTDELQNTGAEVDDSFIFDVISSAFIEGLYLILKHDCDVEKKKNLIVAWARICLFNLHKKT